MKRKRLSNQIKAAKTPNDIRSILAGGNISEIERIAFDAYGLSNSKHPKVWILKASERLEKRFCGVLFPALMKGDPEPFKKMVRAIKNSKKVNGNLAEYKVIYRGEKMEPRGASEEYYRLIRHMLVVYYMKKKAKMVPPAADSVEAITQTVTDMVSQFLTVQIKNNSSALVNDIYKKVYCHHQHKPVDERTVLNIIREMSIPHCAPVTEK